MSRCKSCIASERKEYHIKNQRKILDRSKVYQQQNSERIAKYQKLYRETNQEKLLEQRREWYLNNIDKVKQYNKEYLKLHYLNNKAKYIEKALKRRNKILNNIPCYANINLISRIYDECPEGYHVDHMIPLASGGFHHESNLCYLPAEINLSKGTKTIEEFGIDRFNQHVIYWQDYLRRGNDPLAHAV